MPENLSYKDEKLFSSLLGEINCIQELLNVIARTVTVLRRNKPARKALKIHIKAKRADCF